MDEGLLAFQVNNVNLSTFASQALTYDVQNQTGTNPVWVRIRLVGGTQYQFIPTTNPAGWHTVNAADGQWQLMDNNGNGVGSLMTLSQVATANSGAQVDRVYLTLGMGDSYNVSSGVGTVAWVDTVTIGGTTYNFVTAPPTSPTTFIVTIEKYIDGVPASTTPATTAFQMNQAYTIDSTLGSNPYTLSPSGAGSSNIPYEAITSPLDANSTYTTNEVTGAESPVGADCTANNPYSLVGYSTGGTLADAVTAEQSLTPPSFTDLTQNEYVIVWNHDCSKPTITGTVTSGPGVLHVDSITSNPMNANGIADGSYANGWKYVFHITTPTNEPNFAMSFANWLSGANILPVAGNMRIFSLQSASNTTEGSAIPIVAANTLTTPMVITSDLDAGTAGRQIDVTVEVKIPTGTVNGSYSTSYGVQTLP
jgi:hypothetical protein